MKRVTLGLFAVAMMAASANASTLSLRWAGTAGDKISLAPSQSADIEVVLELGSQGGDNITGVFFSMEAQPITHVSNTSALPGWNAGGQVNLQFGPSQFAVANDSAGDPNDLTGNGTFVLGSFTVHLDDMVAPNGTEFEVVFDELANNQVVDSTGAFLGFTLNVGTQDGYAAYSGYWTFGKGSPGIQQMASSIPRDPLIITKVPEPASLAILALGGFAAIMRRRS